MTTRVELRPSGQLGAAVQHGYPHRDVGWARSLLVWVVFLFEFRSTECSTRGLVDGCECFVFDGSRRQVCSSDAGGYCRHWVFWAHWLSPSSRSFPFLSVWPGPGGCFPHAGGRICSARRFGSVARFVSAIAPVTVLQSSISDHLIWPWSFALSRDAHSNYAWNFVAWFADRGSFQRRRAATGSSRPQLCCAKSAAEKL